MIATQDARLSEPTHQSHHVDAAEQTTAELVRIAAAAASRGAPVTFRDLGPRPLTDLLKIVAAGGRWEGRVTPVPAAHCQQEAHHRVSAADALLPGFLLSRFLCLPSTSSTATTARAER